MLDNINVGLYLGHILTLFLFITASSLIVKELVYVRNTLNLYCTETNSITKSTLYCALVSSLIICVVFIVLQLDWIINDYNSDVGNATSFLWLTFDVFLGIFLIGFTVFSSGVRSKLEYLDRLEKIVTNRFQYECVDTEPEEILTEDTTKIHNSVEESKEGLKLLRRRLLQKDDSKYNPSNGCKK